jgi:CRISPR/Cas system-associated protein Cas10 (large subunit of type III CRISPR-Cas system)
MIGEGMYECDNCGNELDLDALEDLDDAACEICHQMVDVADKVKDGYRRGTRSRRTKGGGRDRSYR